MAETGRMKELIDILNKAASVYYQGKDEIMSNFEYDRMYDELSVLGKRKWTCAGRKSDTESRL